MLFIVSKIMPVHFFFFFFCLINADTNMDDEAPQVVPLLRAVVVDFLHSFFESLEQKQIALLTSLIEEDVLDLSKEFRSRTFAIVHLLLQNPLTQMFSTAVPNLQQSK